MGNSRGVQIPAAFLAACEIGAEIEMRQEGRRIIIEPLNPPPRIGWFNNYRIEKDTDAWEEGSAKPRRKARIGNGATRGGLLGEH